MQRQKRCCFCTPLIAAILMTGTVRAAEPGAAPYLNDRGDGIPTSLLGTYIRERELLFYPFYEYTRTNNFQYKPSDLGFLGETDSFGKKIEQEYLIFMAYAFSDSLMVEFESGLRGSVDLDKKLLGAQHWEFALGLVLTKGSSFGTLALRLSSTFDTGDPKFKFSEYAIDYVNRLSPNWRVAFSLEGDEDERQVISELQYTLTRNTVLKMNLGLEITKTAPDFAPEIGAMFRF